MRRVVVFAIGLLAAAPAVAQTGATPIPQHHVPTSVLLELRALEHRFDQALSGDCAPEKCFSKGCVYREHAAVDMPRSGSLPGLGPDEGPGSVPIQEYLTQARCEFTHEKSVPSRDVRALVKRLEQRLSRGWLNVSVGTSVLDPVSPGLRESPKPPEPPPAPEPKPEPVAEKAPEPPPVPPEWEGKIALRELWLALLPHFSWMIAVVLGTLAALTLIWAMRRLGRESLEEKAMLAQLAANPQPEKDAEAEAKAQAEAEAAANATPDAEETAFVNDQQQVWNDRIAQAELSRDEGMVVELLRDWLKAGEFALLAKAILVFGDRLSLAFPSDGELAMRKIELADYLKNLDEKALPSEAEFFRKLNQHSISSSLLAQTDAEIYRSLREEFGASGISHLMQNLPSRHAALLFAMAPLDTQHEVARIMAPELRVKVAEQLLHSTRISREETGQMFEILSAARTGQPLPRISAGSGNVISDRGRTFDSAGALSVLLPRIETEDRRGLFANALERAAGAFPNWYEDILYPDMLLKLPEELRKDMLLEVDVRGLAGWSSVQNVTFQESFIARMAPAMQNAVKASMAFSSRADQLRMARQGHEELVVAMKKLVARGNVNFPELVA